MSYLSDWLFCYELIYLFYLILVIYLFIHNVLNLFTYDLLIRVIILLWIDWFILFDICYLSIYSQRIYLLMTYLSDWFFCYELIYSFYLILIIYLFIYSQCIYLISLWPTYQGDYIVMYWFIYFIWCLYFGQNCHNIFIYHNQISNTNYKIETNNRNHFTSYPCLIVMNLMTLFFKSKSNNSQYNNSYSHFIRLLLAEK